MGKICIALYFSKIGIEPLKWLVIGASTLTQSNQLKPWRMWWNELVANPPNFTPWNLRPFQTNFEVLHVISKQIFE